MNEKPIRVLTTGAVLLVAAIAAVVSFVHIEHLAITHGQTLLAAVLLPVSIDGTVTAASLVMLRAARAGLGTPWLARAMLGLSVLATLAANVAYGVPFGWPGALLSGWPAVAFIGSAEMAIGMVRRVATARKMATARPVATATTRSRRRPKRVAAKRPSAADTEAAVLSALAASPDLTNAELATVVGTSERTARRYRRPLETVASVAATDGGR